MQLDFNEPLWYHLVIFHSNVTHEVKGSAYEHRDMARRNYASKLQYIRMGMRGDFPFTMLLYTLTEAVPDWSRRNDQQPIRARGMVASGVGSCSMLTKPTLHNASELEDLRGSVESTSLPRNVGGIIKHSS